MPLIRALSGFSVRRNVLSVNDVVLETKVLVSRRLEDKKIKSWSWSWGLGLETQSLGLGLEVKVLVLVLTKKS